MELEHVLRDGDGDHEHHFAIVALSSQQLHCSRTALVITATYSTVVAPWLAHAVRQQRRSRHQGYSHTMAPTSLLATSPNNLASLLSKPFSHTTPSALPTPQFNSTTPTSLSHITEFIQHSRIGASAHRRIHTHGTTINVIHK